MIKTNALAKTIIDRKDFTYTQKGVKLNFNIRVDTTEELLPFRSCLEEAVKDINGILQTMKK